MGEVVNVVVAFAVIVFLFRWLTTNNDSPSERSAADTLGFRPKPVSQDMIDTISNMFPDILQTTSGTTCSEQEASSSPRTNPRTRIPRSTYFTLYPRDANPEQGARPAAQAGGAASTAVKAPKQSLIDRYNLQQRVAQPALLMEEDQIGGKAVWEDSAEKREASLKERKAQMILAARQRMLAQQKQKDAAAAAS